MWIKSQNYDFEWIKDLSGLLFPNICVTCRSYLMKSEKLICLGCLSKLPKTNLHRVKDNFILRKFFGRIDVYQASSFLVFSPGNYTQTLIHMLKYGGFPKVGERLGQLYSFDLMVDGYEPPDLIVPLPLHPAKRKLRGFNQCVPIAKGLNSNFHARIVTKNVVRVTDNSSQTKKGRWDRWLNVDRIFKVTHPEAFDKAHVLLVDDVITTGATLEACGKVLLEAGAEKLSILTLATA